MISKKNKKRLEVCDHLNRLSIIHHQYDKQKNLIYVVNYCNKCGWVNKVIIEQ